MRETVDSVIAGLDSRSGLSMSQSEQKVRFPEPMLNSDTIVRNLGIIAAVLVLTSLGSQAIAYLTGHHRVFGLIPMLNVDEEKNIPTFFSGFLLFSAALLLALITYLKKRSGAPISHWAVLSAGFFCMEMDELWSFHEKLILPGRELLGGGHLGIFFYPWVIPGMVLVLGLGLYFVSFLRSLPTKTRLAFLLSGAVYIGGAIGMELVSGKFTEVHGKENFIHSIIVTVEESLEMTGVILFLRALLQYLADQYGMVRVR